MTRPRDTARVANGTGALAAVGRKQRVRDNANECGGSSSSGAAADV
jgi:hypothetical protein